MSYQISRTRRNFLKLSSAAVGGMGLVWPRQMWAEVVTARRTPGQWAPTVRALIGPRELASRAIEAATRAGATYADVNFFIGQQEFWNFRELPPSHIDIIFIGVRALVQGYWGFAGMEGVPTADDASRLGRSATAQAQTAARGKPRPVDLGHMPVATGSWTTPIGIDPFTVSFEEKADFGRSLADFTGNQTYQIGGGVGFHFARQERIFASSEGAATSQTLYTTEGGLTVNSAEDWKSEYGESWDTDFATLAGAGWEYIHNAPFREAVLPLAEIARLRRRWQPVDVGRYDIVLDANTMANMLSATLANATQLDRAMGYRANTDGTSYLNDPLGMLGQFRVGSPLLTLTTDQSMPGAAGTVQWDCEGVAPRSTALVREGTLVDFQTSRESASWLAPYYQAHHLPGQSNGCAGPDTMADRPIGQTVPNLRMQPGSQDATFEDLVKDTKKGLAVFGADCYADFQVLNGWFYPKMLRRITNGQLGEVIYPPVCAFRSIEFWRNLVAIGGKSSARSFGFGRSLCGMGYSIQAVPGKVTNVAKINF